MLVQLSMKRFEIDRNFLNRSRDGGYSNVFVLTLPECMKISPSKVGGGYDRVEVIQKNLTPKYPRCSLTVARDMNLQLTTLVQSTTASQTHHTANLRTDLRYREIQVLQTTHL